MQDLKREFSISRGKWKGRIQKKLSLMCLQSEDPWPRTCKLGTPPCNVPWLSWFFNSPAIGWEVTGEITRGFGVIQHIDNITKKRRKLDKCQRQEAYLFPKEMLKEVVSAKEIKRICSVMFGEGKSFGISKEWGNWLWVFFVVIFFVDKKYNLKLVVS